MGYGIMHILYGGRHIQAKGGQAAERGGMRFDLVNIKTGEVLMVGTSREVSESDFISVDQRNVSIYAKRGLVASGKIRIKYHEESAEHKLTAFELKEMFDAERKRIKTQGDSK